jgi:DNA-binding NarL/FixJ family response regulator
VNGTARGLAVELAIEDHPSEERIAALLQDLGVAILPPGSGEVVITDITDTLLQTETNKTVILIADEIDAFSALRAGVDGVLPKSAGMTELRIALEAASEGFAIVPVSIIEDSRAEHSRGFDARRPADSITFTPREMEVLALLGEGASNKAIAKKLGISIHTAKFHVASILSKLDAAGRTDAVAHAVRLGLLML